MRLRLIFKTFPKLMMDTHFNAVSITHKPFPHFTRDTHFGAVSHNIESLLYFTIDNDIHFSAISNQFEHFHNQHLIHIVMLYQFHTKSGLEVHPLSSPKPWSTSPISSHTTQHIYIHKGHIHIQSIHNINVLFQPLYSIAYSID